LYEGRTAEALKALEDAAAGAADSTASASVRTEMAALLLERGQAQEAARQIERAMTDAGPTGPMSLQSRAYAALVDMRLGRRSDALQLFDALQREAAALPGDVDERNLHMLAARIALDRGDAVGALEELKAAEALLHEGAGASVELWYELGSAYMAAGNQQEAAAQFERIARSGTQRGLAALRYVRSLYVLGQINEKLGHPEKARDYYRRFASFWKAADLDREHVAAAAAKS
jgi:tetratricopeptide (TPR) repeat protein